jgi:uncharacterized protein
MPRPQDARNDSLVDAAELAVAGSRVERTFATSDLPRLVEAGMSDASELRASFQFLEYDGKPAIDGSLTGRVVLTCQRCMAPVTVEIDDRFQVIVVDAERADEPGGYEPVIAPAARLDLRWLAEDQALLALPLVAMHAAENCGEQTSGLAESEASEPTVQKPFQNLRDMMRKR